MMNENKSVGCEYRKMTVDSEMESMYMDGYPNFGWEFVLANTDPQQVPAGKVVLEFMRGREIPHKAGLSLLQRQFETCAEEIAAMERKKKFTCIMAGIEMGVISCCLAGSITALPSPQRKVLIGILLGIPGWSGFAAAYYGANAVNRKFAAKLEPSIDRKYEEALEIEKEGKALLNDKEIRSQTAEQNNTIKDSTSGERRKP